MKNEKKPAFSVALKDNRNAYHTDAMGLTKLEYFASLAMQAIIAYSASPFHNETAAYAVSAAKALLAELEKQNQ